MTPPCARHAKNDIRHAFATIRALRETCMPGAKPLDNRHFSTDGRGLWTMSYDIRVTAGTRF
jgi:hypothetical protein